MSSVFTGGLHLLRHQLPSWPRGKDTIRSMGFAEGDTEVPRLAPTEVLIKMFPVATGEGEAQRPGVNHGEINTAFAVPNLTRVTSESDVVTVRHADDAVGDVGGAGGRLASEPVAGTIGAGRSILRAGWHWRIARRHIFMIFGWPKKVRSPRIAFVTER